MQAKYANPSMQYFGIGFDWYLRWIIVLRVFQKDVAFVTQFE